MKKSILALAALAVLATPAQAQQEDPGALALSVSMKCVEVYQSDAPTDKSLNACREAGPLVESIAANNAATSAQRNNAAIGGSLMILNQGIYEKRIGSGDSCASFRRADAILANYTPGATNELDQYLTKQRELVAQAKASFCS